MHFPSDPSKGGYTGSTLLGPAMLGIHTISGSNPPATTASVSQSSGKLDTSLWGLRMAREKLGEENV